MVNRELALHFVAGSDDGVEVDIPGRDNVARRASWLARAQRMSCPRWLQEVLSTPSRSGVIAAMTRQAVGDQALEGRTPAAPPTI
jgi:hypothetical protein